MGGEAVGDEVGITGLDCIKLCSPVETLWVFFALNKKRNNQRLPGRIVTRSGGGSRINIPGTPDPQMEIGDC